MRIWHIGRESSLARSAQRDLARAGLLRRQVIDAEARIPTFGERVERWMERLGMLLRMDGAFYRDMRSPFTASDVTAVTLATTDKAIWPVANIPPLGSNYFGFIGKKLAIQAFGRITTAVTPGNGTLSAYWGTGADANGTILQASAAHALTASQTNLSWLMQLLVTCRAFGSSGALLVTGHMHYNEAVVVAKQMVPASAAAQVTVDLTANNVVSMQYKRSGSTVETMQAHDIAYEALN